MPNIKTTAKIVLINILILGLLLVVLHFLYASKAAKPNVSEENTGQPTYYLYEAMCNDNEVENEFKFYRARQNLKCTSKLTKNNHLVKKTEINIDSNGFRKTPNNYDPKKNPAVFFGCSYTFGYGLNDNETFPWLFSELTKRKTYNASYMGFGAQHMLLNLQSKDFKQIVPKADLFIYTFIDDHIGRIYGPPYKSTDVYYPKYTIKNNKLVYVEPSSLFIKNKSLRININSLEFEKKSKTSINDTKALTLFVRILKESQSIIKKEYPNSRFIIFAISENKETIDFLKTSGFEVININDLLNPEIFSTEEMTLNAHPTADFWKKTTPKLIQKLHIL